MVGTGYVEVINTFSFAIKIEQGYCVGAAAERVGQNLRATKEGGAQKGAAAQGEAPS